MSSTLRLGVERRRQPCAGDVETPSFVKKLLSGNRDQGDRGFDHGRDLIAEKRYSECFNNMDVGVPLWLTEPRDKYPRQEFAFSYPALYVSAFYTSFLVCLYFYIVVS